MKKQKRNRNWIQDYFFLIVPNPSEDELLSSWLTRMAIAHRRKLSVFLTLFVKKDGSSISRTDMDFLYDEKLFNSLVVKSSLDKKELLKMSLRSEEGYLFSCNDCLYPPKQIRKFTDKRTHYGLMFCPKCLAEDKVPYYRKKWRYYFYNACSKHKIFLTDRCWVCYEKIKLAKMSHLKEVCFCSKCERDLGLTITIPIQSNLAYGLKAVSWFEQGLARGYFTINKQKIHSLFVFESFTKLCYLLDKKEKLILEGFPLIEEYKTICKKLDKYDSKKDLVIQKDFILTAMVYYLFQNYPNNLLSFAQQNKLTYREFTHGFKEIPFWYKKMIGELVPIQNKIGREISESEVIGAIKYLKSHGIATSQKKVAEIVGCHPNIHKGFKNIYKRLNIPTFF